MACETGEKRRRFSVIAYRIKTFQRYNVWILPPERAATEYDEGCHTLAPSEQAGRIK